MIKSLHANLLAMNRIGRGSVRPQLVGIVVFLIAMATLPLFVGDYWERLLVFMFVNIVLASAWNVIGGVAGYPSFGHGLFFGLGAYASAMFIVRGEFGLFPAIIGGGVVAAAFSLLFIPLLRQKGLYFALSTLSAQMAVETIVRAWSFTRGMHSWDMGWNFPDMGSLHFFYYLMLGLLGLCLVSIVLLLASRVGYALRAIHKDEIVAASVGVPTVRYKAAAFVFSAMWPGIIGGAYGPFLVYISPDNVFSMSITLNMVLVTIFGGLGTIAGPVIGGIVLTLIDQFAWANFLEYHHLIYGLLIVVVITFWPGGLASIIDKRAGAH
jgi:branched-chain amino acid transport system permease protein